MFGKPHLVVNGAGSAAVGDQAGHLQILFRFDVAVFQTVAVDGKLVSPLLVFDIQFLQAGFVTGQKILRIEDEHGILGSQGKNDSRPAGAGEVGQPVAEAIQGVAEAVAGERADGRHDVP